MIGKGSSGKIYLVEKKSNNKLFAMKIQDKIKIIKNEALEKIKIENQILSQFNHPFLVKLHYSF